MYASIWASDLSCHYYKYFIIAIFISLILTQLQSHLFYINLATPSIALVFSGKKYYIFYRAKAKQFAWLAGLQKKNYLQINIFLDLMVIKLEENPHVLLKKTTTKATSKIVREPTSCTRLDLTLKTSILAFITFLLHNWGPSFLCNIDNKK